MTTELIACREALAAAQHTVHTKIPALETAMVLQGERIAALAGACKLALRDAESRLYMLPVRADGTTEKQIIETQIATYRAALGEPRNP